ARGLESVRAALGRLFESFTVHRGMPKRAHLELVGEEIWIEPVIREEVIEDRAYGLQPALHREPLLHAEDNYAVGLTT
ncbi:MAG: hypothetical protein ACR2N5_04745, partial [Solirubrobacterales bacterium]